MKKLLLMASLIASTGAMAQLPDGSICPDFTGTDLNGVTHNLYDYLDQGYTVVVDVSATWCGPCWGYHTGGALENLWDTYGPGTSENKVIVLMIEGDGSTTLADLQGSTGATQGDWITGTPYPIIDNAAIANTLQIGYYPTIYTVCPNRVIRESGQISTAAHWAIANANDCAAAVAGSNLGLVTYNSSTAVCGNLDMEVTMINMGTNTATSAALAVKQAGTTLATQNWNGSLATYATVNVTFTNVAITNPAAVTVEITTSDVVASDNVLDPGLVGAANAPTTFITVELMTDNYGAETYWRILNGAGSMVAEGGNILVGTTNIGNGAGAAPAHATAYANATLYNIGVSVPANDCYTFEAYDFYGDGMCCAFGAGYYKVRPTWGGGASFIDGGEFLASVEDAFRTAAVVGIEEESAGVTNIYPNPTNGTVNLVFNTAETKVNVDVFNVLGERVMTRTLNNNGVQTMDMNSLNNGLYYFNISIGDNSTTHKVTLNR